MYKRILVIGSLALFLAACNDEKSTSEPVDNEQKTQEESKQVLVEKVWTQDERLQEPTEETVCAMCNMKVYTKDHEMGVFSAQAIKADGSIAFYDDIGCL